MNDLLKKVEEVVDREVANDEIKKELSELGKMLKTGFESRTDGYDKVPKLMAVADEKKLKKFYNIIGNQIKALHISGDFKQFADYMLVNHGITFGVADDFPHMMYAKSEKKQEKFYDLYSTYFLEDPPKEPKDALEKISKSINALYKEYKKEEEPIKEDLKSLKESDGAVTVSTLAKVLKKSKTKAEPVENTVADIKQTLYEQIGACEIIEE